MPLNHRRPSARLLVLATSVLVAVGAVVAVLVTVGVGEDTDPSGNPARGSGSVDHNTHAEMASANPARVDPAPDPVRLGPQGRHPQFVVDCDHSHSAPDDPIVVPGNFGGSHLHEFFGATTADAASTVASLAAGDTTCHNKGDTASYWVPALFDGDDQVVPVDLVAYYRSGPGADPAGVQPWPFGLILLAGDPGADYEQPTGIVGWTCGPSDHLTVRPRQCSPRAPLNLRLTFPDCWDGTQLDTADHRSHTAYSINGECPDTHPVTIVQLILAVRYAFSGDPDNLRLASGDITTGHGDVMNAWDDDEMRHLTSLCLQRDQVCGISSNRTDLRETLPIAGL